MERYYPTTGANYTASQEQKNQLNAAISQLQWKELAGISSFPAYIHYMLDEKINQLNAQVDRLGYCEGAFGRYRLLALRDNYKKGDVRRATLYMLEIGDTLVTLAVDEETEKEVSSTEGAFV